MRKKNCPRCRPVAACRQGWSNLVSKRQPWAKLGKCFRAEKISFFIVMLFNFYCLQRRIKEAGIYVTCTQRTRLLCVITFNKESKQDLKQHTHLQKFRRLHMFTAFKNRSVLFEVTIQFRLKLHTKYSALLNYQCISNDNSNITRILTIG